MTKAEIETIIAEKIEAHLKAIDLQPGKAGKTNNHHIYMHLIIGDEPDALYFLAGVIARKTKTGKIKWNFLHQLYQFDNKEGYLSNQNP